MRLGMRWKQGALVHVFLLLCSCASGLAGRSGVDIGDRVSVSYTCMARGEIASTTIQAEIDKPGAVKSPAFLPQRTYEPKEVLAAQLDQNSTDYKEMSFEGEVLRGLGDAVIGMDQGENKKIVISSFVPPNIPDQERFIRLTKSVQRPKTIKMQKQRYAQLTGGNGEMGETFEVESGVRGRILAVNGDMIEVRLDVKEGDLVPTPYGEARVMERGDHFELLIEPQIGTLVRAGPLLGRISAVDDQMMTLDFGHPFGGETLVCDVKVESIVQRAEGPSESKSKPSVQSGDSKTLASSLEPIKDKGAGQGIEEGDVVVLDYTATLESGQVIKTTLASVANDSVREKSQLYVQPALFSPEAVLAGQDPSAPGLAQTLLGLTPGEHRGLRIEPEKAYGPKDPRNTLQYPRYRSIPRSNRMGVSEFRERFKSAPEVGALVPLIPYLEARVVDIKGDQVFLDLELDKRKESNDDFGKTVMEPKGDLIETRLYPIVGTPFDAAGRQGKIVEFDAETFTVDYNHPLAGQALFLDLKIHSVTKGPAIEGLSIDWFTDHAAALSKAFAEQKEVVVMLFTPSCPWSRRFAEEVLEDPRIRMLKERFVWSKVNGDEDPGLMEFYEIKSYPTILLLRPDGEMEHRLEGFRNAGRFFQELTAGMH